MQIASRNRAAGLAVLVGVLSAVGSLGIDAYAPALPAMARDLHTADGAVQLSVSGFVVGLAVGQLLAGSLSDAVGRVPVLVTGLWLFVAGSLLCVVAWNIDVVLLGRAVQALGAARPPFSPEPSSAIFIAAALSITRSQR